MVDWSTGWTQPRRLGPFNNRSLWGEYFGGHEDLGALNLRNFEVFSLWVDLEEYKTRFHDELILGELESSDVTEDFEMVERTITVVDKSNNGPALATPLSLVGGHGG